MASFADGNSVEAEHAVAPVVANFEASLDWKRPAGNFEMVYEWKTLAAAVSLWLREEFDVPGGALDSAGTVAGESLVILWWLKLQRRQAPPNRIQYVT